jgi:hypothetical protein
VTELLEYIPSSFKVVQIMRPKFNCGLGTRTAKPKRGFTVVDPKLFDEWPPFFDIGLLERAQSFRALTCRLK